MPGLAGLYVYMLQLHPFMYNRYRLVVLQMMKANMHKRVACLHNIASSRPIQKRDMAFVYTK